MRPLSPIRAAGPFALAPLAVVDRRASCRALLHNFWWVIVGHILGGLAAATLFAALLTRWCTTDTNDTVQSIIDITVAKTLEYQKFGYLAGAGLALLSGILCNWLVAPWLSDGRTGGHR